MPRRKSLAAIAFFLGALFTACSSVPPDGGPADGNSSISGTVRFAGAPAQAGVQTAPLRIHTRSNSLPDLDRLPTFVPGDVIVTFRDALSPQSLTTLQAAGLELHLVRPLSAIPARLYRTESANEAQTLALVEALKRRSDVAHALPNYLLYPLETPTDPHYGLQWHFPAINLPGAWDITTGSSSTVVAVLDTGILFDPADAGRSHPDFAPSRMLSGYDFVTDPGPIGANDGDGRDPYPYDDGDAATSGYHGTHVAGTIGAWSNNTEVGGVAGIDWYARLLPVRVTGLQSGTIVDFLDGAWWAAGGRVEDVPDNATPADVINVSLGGAAPCDPIVQGVFDALAASGVIVVLAAGNENQDANNSFPANCANVITVGATDVNDTRAFYSNYGSRIDLMAPGGDMRYDLNVDGLPDGVLSPGKDDLDGAFAYTYYHGTSMAAPHVAGLLALMKALDPTLDSADALAILQATARPLTDAACHTEGPGPTEPDRTLLGADCGAGLVDAQAALLAIGGTPPPPPTDPDFGLSLSPSSITLAPGQSATVAVTVNRTGGFSDLVALSLSGGPAGLSTTFSPNPATNSSTLAVAAGTETGPGRYDLVVSGTGGALTRTSPLTLTVTSSTAGLDVAGTVVQVCLPINELECDAARSREIPVTADGAFNAAGLSSGSYEIYAWKDINGNAQVDGGDYLGAYVDAGGNIATVSPPASGLVIELGLVTDIMSLPAALGEAGLRKLASLR